MSKRREIVAGVGVVAVAAGVAWWWSAKRTSQPRVSVAAQESAHDHDHDHAEAAKPAAIGDRPAAVTLLAPAAPDAAAERAEFNRLKADGARQALAGIALNRDFPFWTRPINDSNRWKAPTPFHQVTEDPRRPGRALELWPEKQVFKSGEAIVVHARVLEAGVPIAIPQIEGVTESPPRLGRPEIAIDLRDDGGVGDAIAGDLVYSATVPLDRLSAREQTGAWGYRVRAHFGGDPLETTNQFVVWPGGAELAGKYRDNIDDGSLVIHCAVRANEATEIQVRGELHGPGGEDIAFAWANAAIPEGTTEVELRFWGKAIHDRGVDGPYELRNVVLGYPQQRLIGPEAVARAHVTARYSASQFRSDGFNADDPMFASQIADYEEQLTKAEHGELEPGPMPGTP
jgi:hypothetical protein